MPRIGTRKLYYLLEEDLSRLNIKLGRDAFFDYLRSEHMLIKPRKNYTKTTNSKHWLRKYPNLMKEMKADRPEQVFVSDITYLKSRERTHYLALVTDAYSRKIMGYNLSAKQKDYQALMVKTFYLANSDAKTVGATLKTILKTKDIVVDEKLNLVMIRDSLEAIRLADKLVALQDVPEPEVMLEVEILEVKRSRLQALGINWPDAIALRPLPLDGLTVQDLRNLNSSTIGATVGPTTIRANQTDADVNLLANPRIRARNREKAKILIGDRVPNITSTITATGFSSESVTYIDVGLKLDVEPTIYLDNEVAIKVTLEVSNIVNKITTKTGTVAYQIGTRTATSVLRLKDGENQLLAGLISDEDRRNASKLPFLGDIPLLGRLFGHHNDNIKRMLAYSTISHVGFIFLGLLAGTDQGYASAMFYAMVYAPMAAGSFGILALISRKGFDAENIDDLKGLNERDSWYAAMMALLMFSMAGVPPTVGFMAKLLVLEAVVRIDLVWLAVVAVFFSIIGAFYYLRVVKVMYFDKPLTDAPLVISGGARVAMSVNGLAMLVLGLFPASLLGLCQAAFL